MTSIITDTLFTNLSLYLQGLPENIMQNMAMEMNISETSFLRPLKAGDTFEKGKAVKFTKRKE